MKWFGIGGRKRCKYRNDPIRFGFFAAISRPIHAENANAREIERQTSATRMISLRFLASDEISSKSIHLEGRKEGRIMGVVLATAVAANVSTGRMKVVVLLVLSPLPPFSPFFFFTGLECQNERAGFARGPPCR